MKRILLISDSHGRISRVDKLFERIDAFDYVFFLGDGAEDFRLYSYAYPAKVEIIKGNCDHFYSDYPPLIVTTVEEVTFLLTHGHNYHVKQGLELLKEEAQRKGADVVCFGHTHKMIDKEIDGIRFINPGSLGYGSEKSYIVLEVNKKNLKIVE